MLCLFSMEFQSLFYWKYLSDIYISFAIFCHVVMFQSLFYWKYLSDLPLYQRLLLLYLVSILVLLEVSFRQGDSISPADIHREFQSLFYWKYLSDSLPMVGGYLSVSCFNPCFIGSIFQTFQYCTKCKQLTEFQSLFYWKYLSDVILFIVLIAHLGVSILVLLEVSFRPSSQSLIIVL